jgi:adenosine kinase
MASPTLIGMVSSRPLCFIAPSRQLHPHPPQLTQGNPLLDISASVPQALLDKYGLKLNNAILAEAAHLPLYSELVSGFPVEYIAGGATQNSVRVAQWMSAQPGFSAYVGCIGSDAFGAQLKAAAERDGVTTLYDISTSAPTGTCAVLIHDRERSLVANLGAAEKYSRSHFDSAPVQAAVAGAKIFYSAGFFLTHASEIMAATGAHAAAHGQTYAMNLSAPFLCQFFKAQMHTVLPYADFVFGNESEAAAFAEANGFAGASVEETALRIAALPKASGSRSRVVVITQGADHTVIAANSTVTRVPVPRIDKAAIVDTNGAGDAFVGGFLAYLAKGAPLVEAAHAGHWAAGHVIMRSGCTFDVASKYPGPPGGSCPHGGRCACGPSCSCGAGCKCL